MDNRCLARPDSHIMQDRDTQLRGSAWFSQDFPVGTLQIGPLSAGLVYSPEPVIARMARLLPCCSILDAGWNPASGGARCSIAPVWRPLRLRSPADGGVQGSPFDELRTSISKSGPGDHLGTMKWS